MQKEVAAHLFDKGSAYMGLIIGAGYAGFFTIWTMLNTELTRSQNIAVGISLGLSLSAFIYYEVYKMYYLSYKLVQLGRVFGLPTLEAIDKALEIEVADRNRLPRLYTIWFIVFIFCIATSSVAAVMLLTMLVYRGNLGP